MEWRINKGMEYAKYYNVSKIVEKMQETEEIDCYPTGDDKFEGVYVCMDNKQNQQRI